MEDIFNNFEIDIINWLKNKTKDIEYDGGSLFLGKDGYVDCIEMHAYSNFFKKNISEYLIAD